jgi:geranylgeranyl reductase family protein
MEKFDVAVIGAGPSGAAAAFELAKKGIKTVIIEKETLPRYKTCGGGLVTRGRKLLPFDVSDVVDAEFNEVFMYFNNMDLKLQVKRDFPIISMVMRDRFDEKLTIEAQKQGVTLMQGSKVLSFERNGDWKIETSTESVQAKFIIAADGALSQTAKMTCWKNDTRNLIPALEYEVEVGEDDWNRLKNEARFDIDVVPHGYAWSFPKKNHLSIGIGATKRMKIDLKSYYAEYLKVLEIKTIISESFHGFQIPISMRTDGFCKENVILIGDAAGFADPVTAEGISNAIYSGYLAAQSIVEGKFDEQNVADIYLKKLHEKLIPELQTAQFLGGYTYKKSVIRDLVFRKYGNGFLNKMTDIFTGDGVYPHDVKKTIRKKFLGF